MRLFLPGEKPTVAALILAGGRSARMGFPKDEALLADGRPMLDHVLDVLRPLGIPIRLSTTLQPTAAQLRSGLALIPDATPHEGPLAAMAHALEQCEEDGLLVVGCDQPLLRQELLVKLLPSQPSRRPAFFQESGSGRPIPFPGYFPRSLLSAMKKALREGERSPRRWAEKCDCLSLHATLEEEASLRSFNSAEELRTAGLL